MSGQHFFWVRGFAADPKTEKPWHWEKSLPCSDFDAAMTEIRRCLKAKIGSKYYSLWIEERNAEGQKLGVPFHEVFVDKQGKFLSASASLAKCKGVKARD